MSTHQKYPVIKSPVKTPSSLNIADKFRIYRTNAESMEKRLKDANAVIERLREEINLSRDSEKNLRSQLISAQNRLIYSQQALKKVISLSERQRQNEKISQQIEQKLKEISETIEHIRSESKNILTHISKEMELEKELEGLKSILAAKARESDLMKMEVQTLTAEKKNIENASQQKLRNLENELEKLKRSEVEAKINYREILTYYQRQLEEKDQTIKHYEKERKNFLEEFEPVNTSEINSDKYGHSATSVSPKRFLNANNFDCHKSQTELEDFKANNILSQQYGDRVANSRKEIKKSSVKVSRKKKPQLEFLTSSQPPSQCTSSTKMGGKRRLFIADSNYYMD